MDAVEALRRSVTEMVSIVAAEAARAIRIIEEAVIAPVAVIKRTVIVVIVAVIAGAGDIARIGAARDQRNGGCCKNPGNIYDG